MQPDFHKAVIGLGSNLQHNAEAKIHRAIERLAAAATIIDNSGVYNSISLNNADILYYNCVVGAITCGTLEQFLSLVKTMECELGRNRDVDEVAIDIDVVIWDDIVLRPEELTRDYFLKGYRKIMNHNSNDVKNPS